MNATKIILACGLLIGASACGKKEFNQRSDQASSSTGSAAGDVSNSGDVTGVITGIGDAPADQLPKIQFLGPPCQRLSQCAVSFQLDRPYPSVTEFDWRTNDQLYGQAAPVGQPPWGKPGLVGDPAAQYVPTSGHVSIPAGATRATVYVRNVNQGNGAIRIGVVMSACAYDALLEDCQKMFTH